MPKTEHHKLLARQLRRAFGEAGPPPEIAPLLAMVNEAYRAADEDRALSERSLELASHELAERTESLRSFFESAPFAMGTARLVQDDLVLVTASPTAHLLFGPDTARGRPMRETAVPEPVRKRWVEVARGVIASTSTERFEFSVERAQRTEYYAVTLAHVRSWDGADVVAYVVEDVSEQRALFEQLAQRDRLASVGTLAAGVAHEINNPLSYVVSNVDLAVEVLEELRGLEPSFFADHRLDELLAQLADARAGAERMRVIVRELKSFGRADEEHRRAVDLGPVIQFAAKMAGATIRRRARLVVEIAPEMPRVVGDETRLGQVVVNLLVNAANAIPEGNPSAHRVTLRASCDARGRPYLDVSDTGHGIAAELLPSIFEPFFTTGARRGGTGLGLAIVRAILHRFDGEVRVLETKVGRGTTFRVELARWEDAETTRDEPSSAPPAPRRGRVLVVDDDPMIGTAITRLLGSAHDVVVADGGRSAIDLLRRPSAAFDLVLCDLRMEDGDGLSVYDHAVRGTSLAPRFHFLTADPSDAGLRTVCERDGVALIEKPFDPKQIRRLAATAASVRR